MTGECIRLRVGGETDDELGKMLHDAINDTRKNGTIITMIL